MRLIAKLLIIGVTAIHLGIAWVEMFAWTSVGSRVFKSLPPDLFEPTQAIAANQGLYNAFLAAGLIWSLLIAERGWADAVACCFLLFVAVAGAYGALTISTTIILVQTAPACLAMVAIAMARKSEQG